MLMADEMFRHNAALISPPRPPWLANQTLRWLSNNSAMLAQGEVPLLCVTTPNSIESTYDKT
jgi:hypothetical protein